LAIVASRKAKPGEDQVIERGRCGAGQRVGPVVDANVAVVDRRNPVVVIELECVIDGGQQR